MSRPDRDDYYFRIAGVVASRATCPRASIGAVLVKRDVIAGTGYNGAAPGEPHCLERDQTLDQHLALRHCDWALHAERNALRNAFIPADGATLYVVGPRPVCPNCRDYLASRGVNDIRHRYGVATLDSLAAEIRTWQGATFPHATPDSVWTHLRREKDELDQSGARDPEEIADLFHLVVAAAEANGYDLVNVVATKFAVNLARRWQSPDEHGVVEHVREVAS